MIVSPLWRTRLIFLGAAALALWLGTRLAQQEYFWPVLIAGLLTLLALRRLFALPVDALLLGAVLFGYIAGNRGFAQISLAGGLPLLPAEFTLLVAGIILVVQSAFHHKSPVLREPLNLLIFGWIGICSVRLVFDLRGYGFMAIRDFATVYYAAFFFLAQAAARDPRNWRWLHGCLITGCIAMLVLHPLTDLFPGFFLRTLTIRGAPLIYYKGDLVGTMLSAGAVLTFVHFEAKNRLLGTLLSLALAGVALTTNNRASLVGLATVMVLLVWGRRWRFAVTQAAAGFVAVVVILFAAYLTNISWRQTPLLGVYERVVSIADPFGLRRYSGTETFFKGDNNRFRAVWWETVFNETVHGNPWFGLGFGYDLAAKFVREYYPEEGDEFDTRSPHNVMLTLFGRTGLAGLLPFILIAGAVAWRLVKAARRDDPALGMWCAAWVILVSACFGVVLEGPMGAVVFWIALGIANSSRAETSADSDEEIAGDELRSLPNQAASD